MKWLKGAVRFAALGGYPATFLNEAAQNGIAIWALVREGEWLYGWCLAEQYRLLRPAARKSGVRLRVKKRWGLPFLSRPFRYRGGLAVGAVCAVLLLQLLSRRVWVITVEGNERVPTQDILQTVEELGVSVGCDFNKVDIPTVQLTALQRLPDIGWLTVNQAGSTVTVMVREKDRSEPLSDKAPANVVAAADGVIQSITVTSGQAVVKAGDAVRKGDLLISGVTDSAVGPLLRRASGSVKALVEQTYTVTVPFAESVVVPQVCAIRTTAVLFGLKLPLFTARDLPPDAQSERQDRFLTARGRALPMGWTVTRWTQPQTVTVTRDVSAATAEAYRRLKEAEKGIEHVVSRTVDETVGESGVTVTAHVTAVEELGVVEPIELP